MGVPRLDRYFRVYYGKHIRYFHEKDKSKYIKPDVTLLDTNPLIHKACQQVFNYGAQKRMLNPYRRLSYDEKVAKVYYLYFQWLKEVVEIAFPKETLYIAIDGVAPLAKQIQQRQRRFRATAMREEEAEFDPNQITSGSLLIHNLMKYIHYHSRIEMFKGSWQDIDVVISSHTAPGEGEHKIMDYIRTLPQEKSVCMYGPDGDLIMLGLGCFRDFYLLKENMYKLEEYYILNMHSIRTDLVKDMGLDTFYSNDNIKRGCYDFIYLGFLLGNDFLPKLQMFYLLEDGLELFMKLYKQFMAPSRRFIVNEDCSLNMENLKYFLELIQRDEIKYIEEQDKIVVSDEKFLNRTLNDCITTSKTYSGVKRTLNFTKYRENYYNKKLGITDPEDVKKLVFEFLDGMKWILDYYIKGCPTMEWNYCYHYPPFMIDIITYVGEWKEPRFEKVTPRLPFEQLANVLPPSSFSIILAPYKALLRVEALQEHFSTDIDIDFEGKTQDYQGVVLTPFGGQDTLKKYFKKIKLKGTYSRNTPSKDKLLQKSSSYMCNYKSDFGLIKECNIKSIDLD